ncbi:MAG: LacI family DNA-binding transcriptional regulator, partial [Rhodopila sp.]|nr:LacI family DNA-binding transcriptional regulator [Rhodopila sp.]
MARPTITDVARAAGVSVSTVDRVLTGRHQVRPATVARVLTAADTIGFRAAETARQRLGLD